MFDMCRAKLKGKRVLSKWRCAKVAILYSQRNSTGSQCSSLNSGVKFVISLTFLQSKPRCTVLNPLQSTCLFRSCSNEGGRLSKRRQVLLRDTVRWTQCVNSRKQARQTLLNWSCMEIVRTIVTPVYFTEILKGILRLLMYAESLSTSLKRGEAPTAIIFVLSVFIMSLLLFIHDKTSSIHVWLLTGQNEIQQVVHFVRIPCRQHTCGSRSHNQKLHLTEAGSTVWTKQITDQNPGVLHTQGGQEQTQCHQQ